MDIKHRLLMLNLLNIALICMYVCMYVSHILYYLGNNVSGASKEVGYAGD